MKTIECHYVLKYVFESTYLRIVGFGLEGFCGGDLSVGATTMGGSGI